MAFKRTLHASRRHGGHRFEHLLERPILLHQRHRGLLTDTRDAGDVVARIPLQRLEIDHERWLEPVALAHLVEVVDDRLTDPATARIDANVLGDELEHVEVAGQDDDVEPGFLRFLRQRADDIVSLECWDLDDGDAKRLHNLAGPGKLGAQLVRRALPLRLVFRELLMPKGGAGRIEGRDRICRRGVVERLEEHRCEAVGSIGHLAPAVAQRGHRMEGAVDEVVPVHQQ